MDDTPKLETDICKCGHPRGDHNEFVSAGCFYPGCECHKFEIVKKEEISQDLQVV